MPGRHPDDVPTAREARNGYNDPLPENENRLTGAEFAQIIKEHDLRTHDQREAYTVIYRAMIADGATKEEALQSLDDLLRKDRT